MKKVLLVDDNLSFLKQISVLLNGHYEMFLAKSGALALKIGVQEPPDLILLDIEMPEMDGFETLAQIKKQPELSGIPVIFLTGNQDEETKARALTSGAVDILPKPVDKDFLLTRIELYVKG